MFYFLYYSTRERYPEFARCVLDVSFAIGLALDALDCKFDLFFSPPTQ